jgi:hypothetical protein
MSNYIQLSYKDNLDFQNLILECIKQKLTCSLQNIDNPKKDNAQKLDGRTLMVIMHNISQFSPQNSRDPIWLLIERLALHRSLFPYLFSTTQTKQFFILLKIYTSSPISPDILNPLLSRLDSILDEQNPQTN